jgi:hypothetical protein
VYHREQNQINHTERKTRAITHAHRLSLTHKHTNRYGTHLCEASPPLPASTTAGKRPPTPPHRSSETICRHHD